MEARELNDRHSSVRFYQDRYEAGYMDDWPIWKKRRVRDLIRSLRLPTTGRALDFGCGQGIFTQVVKDALPEWDVYGCDLSETAVEIATRRFPSCSFFVAGHPPAGTKIFDLLLTHHVLEHVVDLSETFAEMAELAARRAAMIHILPCGNPGSLEQRIASTRRSGIDPARGNRLWFEDEGHLRRLTTGEMVDHQARHGFALSDARYANQHQGAIEWITASPIAFIEDFADATQAIDPAARQALRRLRMRLLLFARLRALGRTDVLAGVSDRANAILRRASGRIARTTGKYCEYRAEREWRSRSREECGSEMYLTFTR
jgi:SAM-dependent methyltransferase